MSQFLKCNVVSQGDKEFQTVLNEYGKWNKRQPQEIAVAKAYFIDLNAMSMTKTANKQTIADKLKANSNKYDAPLAAILVNKALGKADKKGLNGEKMKVAEEKFIKKQQSRTQFLRSCWIVAAKQLDYWNRKGDVSFSKRFAPKRPPKLKQYGKDKGYAQVSNTIGNCSVTIANMAGEGKQASKTVQPILKAGLVKAVARETKSMLLYITKKYQEQFARMQRKNTF